MTPGILAALVIAGVMLGSFLLGGMLGRLYRERVLPAATRRAIRRDRAQRIADISRARRTTELPAANLGSGQERMLGAIAKLGDHYEPPNGWQERAISAARWRPCAACGLPLYAEQNARLMPGVGVVCIPCGTGKERPRG